MIRSGGSPSEMSNLPRFSTRQLPDAASAEGLLAGRGVAPEAPVGQQALARLLEIAASPALDRELAGEAAAVAAFARVTSLAGARSAGARPRTVLASRSLARLALALTTACVTALGGTAAAAGALPAPIQELAHVTFGAPAPHHGVPAPRPAGGSSRQPVHQGIQPKGQPGLQKARVKSQKAHPDGTAKGHQKVHGRRAHSHGQPGHHGNQPGRPSGEAPGSLPGPSAGR
jgi:hypothetical protein